jgi:hypothetical protein
MFALIIILTPILLLGVVALLGFVGCNQVFGIGETELEVNVSAVSPASGPTQGGQQVIVAGSSFDNNAKVTFGGAEGTVTAASETILVVNTPPHSSGAVDVTVTKPDGNSGTLLSTDPLHYTYAAVVNLGSSIVSGNDLGTAQASVAFSGGPKLIVVTVIYEQGRTASLAVAGGSFSPPIKSDLWSSYKIETSYAVNVPPGPNVVVTATLSSATVNFWYMCVTVYDNANPASPVYAPNSLNSINSSSITPITIQGQEASDLVYSLAVAQTTGGSFITTGSLGIGMGFQSQANNGPVLVQDQQLQAAGPVSVTAATSGTNTGRWYILGMGITHA